MSSRVFRVGGTEHVYIVTALVNSAVVRAVILRFIGDPRDLLLQHPESLGAERHGVSDGDCWWIGTVKFDGCSDAHIGGDMDGETVHRYLHLCGQDEIQDFIAGLRALHTVTDRCLEDGLLDGVQFPVEVEEIRP